MKKLVQKIYIGLFLTIILVGSVLNLKGLTQTISKTVKENIYEAWAIVIGLEYNDNFWGKYSFINLNGTLRNLLGQREMNEVVKLDCGKLVSPVEEFAVYQQAQNTMDLYAYLQQEDIPFAYIQMPYEICKYDSQLPEGVNDYSNAEADVFLDLIANANIPTMDLRDEMHEEGMEHYDAFYMTDHHWKTETAFWAYTKIARYLGENLGVEIPDKYIEASNWEKEVLEDCMLGSNGRLSSLTFGGVDDLTLMYPSFDTHVSLEIPTKDLYLEGSFQDAYMDYSWLEGDNLYDMIQYNVYIGEDCAWTKQNCEDAPVDKKILILKDSYFRPVQAFLGTVFSRIDTIDMRVFEGDVKEYINEMKPDMILMCYNPFMLQYEGNFIFEKQLGE